MPKSNALHNVTDTSCNLKTLALLGSKIVVIMHPNGTPKIKGVKKAKPIIPYPFLISTNRLRFLYLILKTGNRSKYLEIAAPNYVNTATPIAPPAATINIS